MGRVNEVLNLDREQRKRIDRLLAQGKSKPLISQQFGVSVDSLRNYESVHMTGRAMAAWDRSLKSHTENLFNELLELADITKQILRSALEDNHRGLSLKAVQQVRNNLETLTRFVLSMEELKIKQNTIEVDQANEERTAQMMKEGLAYLTPAERTEYRRLCIKILEGWGGGQKEEPEEDPESSQDIEYRVDESGHSLQPTRTRPRPADPDPAPGRTTHRLDQDPPMRRTTPRQ